MAYLASVPGEELQLLMAGVLRDFEPNCDAPSPGLCHREFHVIERRLVGRGVGKSRRAVD